MITYRSYDDLADEIWVMIEVWTKAGLHVARIEINHETARAEERRLHEVWLQSRSTCIHEFARAQWRGWGDAMSGDVAMEMFGVPIRFVHSENPFRLIPERSPLVFGASA